MPLPEKEKISRILVLGKQTYRISEALDFIGPIGELHEKTWII
jgi:hypothetical protein